MTAKAYLGKNTLRPFTNGDFSRLSIDNELSPQVASVAILCQVLHRRWSDLFTITSNSKEVCRVFVLRCQSASNLTCLVSFHRVTCHVQFIWSFQSHSYIHAFIHQYFHMLIYTHIHAYTTYAQHQSTHGCISHPKSWSIASLRFNSYLSSFKWSVLTNGQFEFTSLSYAKWQVLTNEHWHFHFTFIMSSNQF